MNIVSTRRRGFGQAEALPADILTTYGVENLPPGVPIAPETLPSGLPIYTGPEPTPYPGGGYVLPDITSPAPSVAPPSSGIQTAYGTEEFPRGTPIAVSQLPSGLPLGPSPRVAAPGFGQQVSQMFSGPNAWVWIIGIGAGVLLLSSGRRRR
jgi:hypothetical protein